MTLPTASASSSTPRRLPPSLLEWGIGLVSFFLLASLTGSVSFGLYVKAGHEVTFLDVWLNHMTQWLPWSVMVPIISWLSQRFPFQRARWFVPGLIHLFTSLFWLPPYWLLIVFGMSIRGTLPWSDFWSKVGTDFGLSRLMDYYWYWVIVIAIHTWVYLRATVRHKQEQTRLELKNLALNQSLTEARLAGLQAQLQPHFLYNTHNTIAALIRKNKTDDALKVLHQLSNLLRYNLSREPHQLVPLSEELSFLDQYLDIQKLRFPTRLRSRIEIEKQCAEALIPPMLLQPLMENAVQHGILSESNGDTISLRVVRRDDELLIEMTNATGPASTDGQGFGIGLKNTRNRLRHLFGDRQSLELEYLDEKRIAATITLPFQTNHE